MTVVTAEGYFRKAERALVEARVLLREGSAEGVCNRAYYAMHDAAHAALLAGGYERPETIIKTHHGLIAEFGKRIVQAGKIDSSLGRVQSRPGHSPCSRLLLRTPASRRCDLGRRASGCLSRRDPRRVAFS